MVTTEQSIKWKQIAEQDLERDWPEGGNQSPIIYTSPFANRHTGRGDGLVVGSWRLHL